MKFCSRIIMIIVVSLLAFAGNGNAEQYTASGTFVYSDNGTTSLTLTATTSDFVCDGLEQGEVITFAVTWNSATEVVLAEPGFEMTWTRTSGTATVGNILGSWSMSEDPNTFAMTYTGINSSGTFQLDGDIVACSEYDPSEEYSVWPGVSRSMTGAGTTDTTMLHFHLWAPEGTVTSIEASGPSLPGGSYTFTESYTGLRGGVVTDEFFPQDIAVTIDPAVNDVYSFTVTRTDSSTFSPPSQTIDTVILEAPDVTSPTGHTLADANLGSALSITWTAPAEFTADTIMIQGGVCTASGDGGGVDGSVIDATSGTITLPNLEGAIGAYIDIRVHYDAGTVFSNTRYDFGTSCNYVPPPGSSPYLPNPGLFLLLLDD